MRQAVAALCLCAPLVLSGCGKVCTSMYVPAFSVSVRAPEGALPDDLVIRLYLDGVLETTVQGLSTDYRCMASRVEDAGSGGGAAMGLISCGWGGDGDGPWEGVFEATANGYQAVRLELTAEPDASGCHPVTARAEVVLDPA